jgi:general secretion pathway protein G
MNRSFCPRPRLRRGMTLIEIVVVVAIISVITSAVAVYAIRQYTGAKRERVALDFKNIESALELYVAKKGNYPDTGSGLNALVNERILKTVPVDPWGSPYLYRREDGQSVLVSLGADRAPGGSGDDEDLALTSN